MIHASKYSKSLDYALKNLVNMNQKYLKLLKWNKSEEVSILDIGMGDGKISKELILPIIPKGIREYVGSDVHQTVLNFAKEKLTHPKFTTVELDVTTKNLPKEMQNRFDYVFALHVFHHVPDLR